MTKTAVYALAEIIDKKFRDNKHFYEVGVELDPMNRYFIRISIEWGDWKHDHLYANFVVRELLDKLGIKFKIDEYVTEEDGDDAYSGDHLIRFEV